jgi:hypothetical protein
MMSGFVAKAEQLTAWTADDFDLDSRALPRVRI